jgi:selenocysteine lyase/cysteine desulfurase
MPDVPAITAAAHSVGALAYIDGVHYTAHEIVDMVALGADFFACSPYKFLGPHHGILAGRPELLEQLHPEKLLPSTEDVPERFELGTLPYELIVGSTAAIDFLAHLIPGEGTRRERLVASFAVLEEHEQRLRERMVAGLSAIDGVTLYGSAPRRTPTVLFSLAGTSPRAVYEGLAARGVNAPAGSFYAIECARWMGLGEAGAVRAGIAPYTNNEDVDRLVEGVAALA